MSDMTGFDVAERLEAQGDRTGALEHYLRQAETGASEQQRFLSLLRAGRMLEALERPVDEALAVYELASAASPDRIFPREQARG